MGSRTERIDLSSSADGIDDHEIRTPVLVLHRPQLLRPWLYLKAVVVALHGVGGDDIAIAVIFNDGAALAVGPVRGSVVPEANEDVAIEYGNRIGLKINSRNTGGECGNSVRNRC